MPYDNASTSEPISTRVDRGIYQRGPKSFQVKIRVLERWITATFSCLQDAQDYRDLKMVAKRRDPDFRRVVAARAAQRQADKYTLDDLLEMYLNKRTAKKKKPEAEKYRIGKIRAHAIAKLPFSMVTDADIQAFLDSLVVEVEGSREGNNAPTYREAKGSTKLRYVAIIRNLYNVARKRWKIKVPNPCADLELPEPPPPRERRISEAEYSWLLQQLEAKIRRNRELRKLVRLAMATACRQGELADLDWRNVDLKLGVLTVIAAHSKTGKTRTVPLLAEAIAVLQDICGDTAPSRGRVFKSTQNALRLAWHRAVRRARKQYEKHELSCGREPDPKFLADLHFHDIRHESISSYFENYEQIRDLEVAALAGHASLSMTQKYAHLQAVHLARKLRKWDEERQGGDDRPEPA